MKADCTREKQFIQKGFFCHFVFFCTVRHFNSVSCKCVCLKKDVMTHEYGHVAGLDETNSDPASVMCQKAYGRTAHAPSDDDYDGAEYLYS